MLHEWLEWRDALARFMNEHRIVCQAPTPDPVAVSGARWRISQASRQRASWLAAVVHPLAERLAHTPGGAAWPSVCLNVVKFMSNLLYPIL